MAPNASDPKDLKLVLNPARRKALLALLGGIVSQMRKKIEISFEASTDDQIAPLFHNSEAAGATNDPERERMRRLDARIEKNLKSPKMLALREDVLAYFDRWSRQVRNLMKTTCEGPEDPRSEQRRQEFNAARNPPPPAYTAEYSNPKDPEAVVKAKADELLEAKDISMMHEMYPPVQTRLTTISKQDRICVISCLVLALLSLGHYSAHSRVLLCYLTSSLDVPLSILTTEETEIAQTLMLASKALSADEETKKRQADNATSRKWKVGLASVGGALVIGITGGIAAPLVAGAIGGIMGGVGLGGVASFLGIFAMNGALMGTLFGAFGATFSGEMMDNYAKEVSDFKFLPVPADENSTQIEAAPETRRLRVTVGINGWLNNEEDVVKPWRVMGRESEVFALRYEMEALITLGTSLESMVSSYAWSYVKLEILKRTVLATLWSALWPVYLLKMATSIDNPFAVARNRSEKAGAVLADALINKAQGERPVTLIGYSLGSRVIYSCLRSLAERKAFGLVENVILIGSPIPSSQSNWRAMRSVVSGKLMNVYSENDFILAFMYRATSIQLGVAGLQKIKDVEGVDNLDLSKEVSGHLRYPELIGKILKRCGVEGVNVEDGDIEKDVSETQLDLIDFDIDGYGGDLDAKGLSDNGILDLLSSEPRIDAPSNSQVTGNEQEHTPPLPLRPAEDLSTAGHQHQHPRSMENTTDPISDNPKFMGKGKDYAEPPPLKPAEQHVLPNNHQHQPPQYTETRTSRIPDTDSRAQRYDSDSDEGGIQMIDNDSDGELQMLSGDPIPDDEPRSGPSQMNTHNFPHRTR